MNIIELINSISQYVDDISFLKVSSIDELKNFFACNIDSIHSINFLDLTSRKVNSIYKKIICYHSK